MRSRLSVAVSVSGAVSASGTVSVSGAVARRARLAALVMVAWAGVAPRAARAAQTDADADWCSAAYEGAQELRLDGRLVESRQKLLACGQSRCPTFMQTDCARWDAELDAIVPTIILTARDGAGNYLIPVRVSEGGKQLVAKLDGRSLPINPGQHTFTFEAPGQPAVVVQAFIPEGDKGHVIQAQIGQAPVAIDVTDAAPRTSSARPVVLYTLGAVGAVGLAGFGIFALSGTNAEHDLRGQPCATTRTCTTAQTDPVERKYLLADISLAVGVVALGAATYVLLSGPSAQAPASAAGFDLQLQRGRGFATYTLQY